MKKLLIILLFSSVSMANPVNDFIAMGKKVIQRGSPEWQVKIYKKYICHPELLKVQWALITSYNGNEPSGKRDGHSHKCSLKTGSANLIPQYYYVWSAKYGMRQILDTGAKSNDRKAKKRGCRFWIDYWYPTADNPIDGWNKVPVIVLKP